jgi:tetratricopeptide (TPR) repeat protein
MNFSKQHMIDDKVSEIAGLYIAYWSGTLGRHLRYALDSSWPSIGTVQLTLAHLVGKQEFSQGDKSLINGAAAYLATLAHNCWQTFDPDMKVELRVDETVERNISLSAEGGSLLPGRAKFQINITSALGEVLRAGSTAARGYLDYSLESFTELFAVPLFALGLLSGLSPFGEGPWKDLKQEDEGKVNVNAADVFLARSTAEHFAGTFPADFSLANPLSFSRGVILPPPGLRENHFSLRAAFTLAGNLHQKGESLEEIHESAANCMLSSNACLACAGYIAATASLGLRPPSGKFLEISDAFGTVKLLLRPAIAILRKVFDQPESVPALLKENKSAEAEQLLAQETELGLAPLLRAPLSELSEIPNLPFYLFWLLPEEARRAIDEYTRSHAVSPAVILQGLEVDLFMGNIQRAAAELQNKEKNFALKDIDSPLLRSFRDEIIARTAVAVGDLRFAETMFQRALELDGLAPRLRSRLLFSYAECLEKRGAVEESMTVLETIPEIFPLFDASLGLYRLKRTRQPEAATDELLQRLVARAPRDFRIFSWLLEMQTNSPK